MTEATAIAMQAEIVGMRNVDTHKSAVLTVHIPQELAARFVDQFGWPTKVDPIPIAIARLNLADAPNREDLSPTADDKSNGGYEFQEPDNRSYSVSAAKPKREMTLASRVAIICKDKMFQSFCFQQLDYEPIGFCPVDTETRNEESTSNYVRKRCKVKSRSEIKYDTPEAANWKSLYEEFQGSEYAA